MRELQVYYVTDEGGKWSGTCFFVPSYQYASRGRKVAQHWHELTAMTFKIDFVPLFWLIFWQHSEAASSIATRHLFIRKDLLKIRSFLLDIVASSQESNSLGSEEVGSSLVCMPVDWVSFFIGSAKTTPLKTLKPIASQKASEVVGIFVSYELVYLFSATTLSTFISFNWEGGFHNNNGNGRCKWQIRITHCRPSPDFKDAFQSFHSGRHVQDKRTHFNSWMWLVRRQWLHWWLTPYNHQVVYSFMSTLWTLKLNQWRFPRCGS